MSGVVLDASALLALLLGEPGADVVAETLDGAVISAVNLGEVAGYYAKQGATTEQIAALLDVLPLEIVVADRDLALGAGILIAVTHSAGLSLGDRFCLVLARERALPALTADRA